MIQTLKNKGLLVIVAIAFFATALITLQLNTSPLYAQDIQQCLEAGVSLNTDCNDTGGPASGEPDLEQIVATVINIFSLIVGIVAVIMIIYGGFRYITSGGDSGNIGTAKNTILYAIVGLIIVALAQVIVRFVLGATTT